MKFQSAFTFFRRCLLLTAALLLVGCTTTQVVTDLNDAATYIDDGLTIAGALGVVSPAIAADFAAGEACIDQAVPVLQAGGNVGTIAKTVLQDCGTAVAPLIPAGTDASLAAKVQSAAQAIAKVLSGFNVTVSATATPAATPTATASARAMTASVPVNTTVTWTPAAGDKAVLKKLAAHKFKPLPHTSAELNAPIFLAGVWDCFTPFLPAGLPSRYTKPDLRR